MTGVTYQIAGMSVTVEADFSLPPDTFSAELSPFLGAASGEERVLLRHHAGIPEEPTVSGAGVRQGPWRITPHGTGWRYEGHYGLPTGETHRLRADWSADHAVGDLYHADLAPWQRGRLTTLSLMPSDQIWLGRVLAPRQGVLLHAAGMVLDSAGVLFIGHSGAGKSTTVRMLRSHGRVLCDDRMAVRRGAAGYQLYGTWHHSVEVPEIAPGPAPLRALCFIEQAHTNAAIPLTDRQALLARLLPCVVKPLVTPDWWAQTLETLDGLLDAVPAYRLQRDLSGRVVDALMKIL